HDAPTPDSVRDIINSIATERYPKAFDRTRGILRFERCEGRLRETVAPIGPKELERDDIRYFAERNPHHARGDELCCLGLVDLRFACFFALRQVRRSLSRVTRKAVQ
ncbi:MAG: hypothetical protein AAF658_04220, partial [Myxococcota bacterium]